MATPEEQFAISSAINNLAAVHDQRLKDIAEALGRISTHLKYLGVGNAGSETGAIELLAMEIRNAASTLSDALQRDDYNP